MRRVKYKFQILEGARARASLGAPSAPDSVWLQKKV